MVDEGLCETSTETKVVRLYLKDWKWIDANRCTISDDGRKRTETDAEVLHRLRTSLLTVIGSVFPQIEEKIKEVK